MTGATDEPAARPRFVRTFLASAALEWALLRRARAFVALTALAAVSFLAMVSLFGLTGSYAPVALIDESGGPYARRFTQALADAHHSFKLHRMSPADAEAALHTGRLVGILKIPADFDRGIARNETVAIDLRIDNVNVDLTNDVQRALPAAIVAFGREGGFPGVRVTMREHDVIPHDTGYIPYLVVSALALDALVIAAILGAMATAREWEQKTQKILRLAPARPSAILAGKLAVASSVAIGAVALAFALVVFGYGVVPVAPLVAASALAACVVLFTCLGAWLGSVVQRTLAAVPLLFGLAMPFYIDSGALEPTRFDGERIFRIAHASPIYYAVGVLEWAFHGLRVTPEPPWLDLAVLVGLAAAAVALTLARFGRGPAR